MSESFEVAMTIFRENLASMYNNGHMTKWADVDTSVYLDRLQRAHDHEIEQMRKAEYSHGYEDGRRSKDADHAAVALRLSRLKFDGGSHENLSKIAQAVYPCATGWTCESSKGLRDRLIDLLGGVHEHHHRCGTGRDCACGDSRARGVGEPAKTITYDVLGNERHKAVCELRKMTIDSDYCGNYQRIALAIGTVYDGRRFASECVRDRLIYLLGGNEKYYYLSVREDGSIDSLKSVEEADELIGNVRRRADQSRGSSPIRQENETRITDELRDYLGENGQEYDNYKGEMIGSISGGLSPIYVIADRIDKQFGHIYHQQGAVLQSAISYLTEECNELHAERDELRAKLDEADAAIANWRVRERSFEESERERDELRRSLRQIAERAGVPHDRDLSEYSDGQIANAVIGQLGQTNQYVKSLEWVRDRRLPRIEAERVKLKAKLDAIREAINDGE